MNNEEQQFRIEPDARLWSAADRLRSNVSHSDDLREEAAQGRREDFDRFLKAVPDVPDEADRS